MSTKFFAFLLVFAIVSSVANGEDSGKKCMPGKSYFDGCNWCYCHKSGFIGCTEVDCSGNPEINTLNPPEEFWQPVTPAA
ncbi:uncharacterized protein LOC143340198 [Colletes latitarsis]|uniref:uncharacterized protein LOC143340198 n=1 Tax=Colletes latitarsis TaxID=2605962 RepID=UPI004035C937